VINSILLQALCDLDDWLIQNKLSIDLQIIGGIALHLHKIDILRATMDIDLANQILDLAIIHRIREIGRGHGLDETWIESPGVPLPRGSKFLFHEFFNGFKNISVTFLDLDSLILTKIAAYYDRKHIQTSDVTDIEAIIKSGGVFNYEVLNRGIQFIRETRRINEQRIDEVVRDLRELI